MQTRLRNWIIGGAAFCMAGSLFAGAKPGGYDDHEKRLRALEHHARRNKDQNEAGRWGGVNPSARGCPIEWGFFATLEFIYWRAQNHGFAYAYDQFEGFGIAANSASLGNYVRISQDWDPGFKVGLGFNTAHDFWDIYLNWTYYHNRSTASASRPQKFPGNVTDGLHSVWPTAAINPAVSGAYQDAFGLWRLNHNALDLEIARAFYLSKNLAVRPHWGVRAAWLYQDFVTRFRDNFVAVSRDVNTDMEDNYWGVGPRAGMKADWILGYGVGIWGQASASLLYGKTMTYFLTAIEDPNNSGIFRAILRHKDNYSQVCPTIQMQLGLSWGDCFDDWFFFGLSAAWEVNYYWNRMNLPTQVAALGISPIIFPPTNNKPVTMEGMTFSAKLDF